MSKKRGLGMGMDALFFENSTEQTVSQMIRLSDIEPNKEQPRMDFDDEAIETLADSIKQHGLLQPLLVRPMDNGSYQIVAGERRWRACRMLAMDEIPVIIKELSDKETMQAALIENLQRENLNPIEEAKGYKDLIDNYNMTQEVVAKIVGKSRSVVANALRTLNLPKDVQEFLRSGELSVGHAKILAGIDNENLCNELAKKCISEGLTVRSLEKIVSNLGKDDEERQIKSRDSYFTEVELSLKNEIGRKVKVNASKKGAGTIQIEFFNKEDLALIAKVMSEIKNENN